MNLHEDRNENKETFEQENVLSTRPGEQSGEKHSIFTPETASAFESREKECTRLLLSLVAQLQLLLELRAATIIVSVGIRVTIDDCREARIVDSDNAFMSKQK